MPRRCLTARRYGNNDDTGVITTTAAEVVHPPPSPPLRPSLVATPALRLMKAKVPGPDDDSYRPPPPAWYTGHRDALRITTVTPHLLFPNDRKDGWDRRCRLARP
ncbi:hypothetical protein WOLCODRAFT_147558 [Wolfiporia cocos MD-104 SS10]|uniref:Uncharacterized protein n=1 Tax=Wolfiporia cocos (strain MD-104) TaxID=742152 RepID=A0A2H3J9Y6_WOLCO|nr:hypothetical protein WOLCODRAFT_147558 [Wolfiporia cocos MD-104 SS10]